MTIILKELNQEENNKYIQQILNDDNSYDNKDTVKVKDYQSIPISFGVYIDDIYCGGIYATIHLETCHISLLGVSKDHRNKKIGSLLVEKIESLAKEQYKCTSLTVTTFNYQAPTFYQKKGFKIFAELSDVPLRGVTKFYLIKRL